MEGSAPRIVHMLSGAPGTWDDSFIQRHRDEALGPPVLVQRVLIYKKAVRLVAEPGQLSSPHEAVSGLLLGGVGAKDLQIVPIFLVPDQFSVLTTMFSRSAVEERRMPNVPEQVNVHRLTVEPRPTSD